MFAADLKEDSQKALLWMLRNVYRHGDVIHLVHVAKLKVTLQTAFRIIRDT